MRFNIFETMFRRLRNTFIIVLLLVFSITSIASPSYAQIASVGPITWLPKPGTMVHLSPGFTPASLRGIVIHPEDPLKFDFIVLKGDQELSNPQKIKEYTKLVKYFLASLTIPDDDQWVNLSPYEKDRIIKDDFGKTEMGRDLLAQDYILKQITASLIYPEDNLGKRFWDRVYSEVQERYGAKTVPINTFNKVWIVPDDAEIYENGNMAFVIKSHLKVMMEEDYLSLNKHLGIQSAPMDNKSHSVASKIVKEIVLPELEKEVNEGKNFAPLRQVFSGMILAAWYKRALKESFLSKIYADKAKVKGVDQDPRTNEQIYRQYLKAYKKGVFNYIREDVDKYTNEAIPRKYFSGGFSYSSAMITRAMDRRHDDGTWRATRATIKAGGYDSFAMLASVFKEFRIGHSKRMKILEAEQKVREEKEREELYQRILKSLEGAGRLANNYADEAVQNLFSALLEKRRLDQNALRALEERATDELTGLVAPTAADGDEMMTAWSSKPAWSPKPEKAKSKKKKERGNKFIQKDMARIQILTVIRDAIKRSDLGYSIKEIRDNNALAPWQEDIIQRLSSQIPSLANLDNVSKRKFILLRGKFYSLYLHSLGTAHSIALRLQKGYVLQSNFYYSQSYPQEAQYDLSFWHRFWEKAEKPRPSIKSTKKKILLKGLMVAAIIAFFAIISIDLKKEPPPREQSPPREQPPEHEPSKIDQPPTLPAKSSYKKTLTGKSSSQEPNRAQLINNPGGIDLNSAMLSLHIRRDGRGIPLPLSKQDMAQISSIQGLEPHILKIEPAVDLPIMREPPQKF